MNVQLREIAFARSGDKGDTANVGLIAVTEDVYPVLEREVTAERVKRHFRGICEGEVERYELPNLRSLNFLLHGSLGGGGTRSLMLDAQGKTFSTALLRMEIEAPEEVVAAARRRREEMRAGDRGPDARPAAGGGEGGADG